MSTHTWQGASGQTYVYTVYDIDGEWPDAAGLFIFARPTSRGWQATYIGETQSFRDRIPDHERKICALRHGATHVHVRASDAEAERQAEEVDLKLKHRPSCNH